MTIFYCLETGADIRQDSLTGRLYGIVHLITRALVGLSQGRLREQRGGNSEKWFLAMARGRSFLPYLKGDCEESGGRRSHLHF